jgi:hypothetical protein
VTGIVVVDASLAVKWLVREVHDEPLTIETQIGKGEMVQSVSMKSGIRDNRPSRGTVASFLKGKIHPGANLSFVSAYFTIYAYETLREQLDQAEHLRFLFGEPRFIQGIDPETRQRAFYRTNPHRTCYPETRVGGDTTGKVPPLAEPALQE